MIVRYKHSALVILFAAIWLTPRLVFAQAVKQIWPLIPANCLGAARQCGLSDMVQVAVNLAGIMLGLLGSVTFLIFIYGGLTWLTAAGNAERISRGRKVFEGALVGLVIVLSSWVIINFIIAALTGKAPGEPVILFPNQGKNEIAPFQVPR